MMNADTAEGQGENNDVQQQKRNIEREGGVEKKMRPAYPQHTTMEKCYKGEVERKRI
jgi:hypothetical protein